MIGINRFTSSIVAARRSQTGFISIQKLVKSSVDAPEPGFEGSFPLQLSGMACTKERLRNDPAPVYSRESHLWTGTTGSVVKSRLPPSSSTATPVNRPGAMQRTDPTDPTSSHSCIPSMDLSVLNTLHYDFIPDTAHFLQLEDPGHVPPSPSTSWRNRVWRSARRSGRTRTSAAGEVGVARAIGPSSLLSEGSSLEGGATRGGRSTQTTAGFSANIAHRE